MFFRLAVESFLHNDQSRDSMVQPILDLGHSYPLAIEEITSLDNAN